MLFGRRTAAPREYSFRPQVQQLESRLVPHADHGLDLQFEVHDHDHLDDYEILAAPATSASLTPLATASATHPLSSLPVLNSLPGAAASLYLDFDGHFEAHWGGFSNITTPVFDLDGDVSTFSDSELAAIDVIWKYVAEDYAPFNINVTTVAPPSFADKVALRVAIGYGSWYYAGGVSCVNSFTNAAPNTAYVFPNKFGGNLKYMGIAAAHEAGHAFGLQHQNAGTAEWAALMTGATIQPRSLWVSGVNTTGVSQDDMAVIAGAQNGFGYRADDHGNAAAFATAMAVNGNQMASSGVIGTASDRDYFSFSTNGGPTTLTVTVPADVNNLDARLELRSQSGALLASSDPSNSCNAPITLNLAAGSYYLVVAGHGNYGDVGQYAVTVASGAVTTNPGSPTAPVDFTAEVISAQQVHLQWTSSSHNETHFVIQRSGNQGKKWKRISIVAADVTAYTDTIRRRKTYEYRIYAVNEMGPSAYSACAEASAAVFEAFRQQQLQSS